MAKADEAAMARTPQALLAPPPACVAGYYPIHHELPPGGVMQRFMQVGAQLCLPVVSAPDAPLTFRAFAFGDALHKGAFGVLEPTPDQPEVSPDLILTPLLGFDATGARLGYGGGYYDRTLAALRARGPVTAVGLAYEVQRLERTPREPHDQLLDWIITESAAYRCTRLDTKDTLGGDA